MVLLLLKLYTSILIKVKQTYQKLDRLVLFQCFENGYHASPKTTRRGNYKEREYEG